MLSGLAHDPIQRDMFWALWVGGTIVVPDPDEMAATGWSPTGWGRQDVHGRPSHPAMGHLVADGISLVGTTNSCRRCGRPSSSVIH